VRRAIFVAQLATGYAFPNALLQHALPDLETLSIDVDHLQRKRDRLVGEMAGMGYQVNNPEGTFYVLARSPWPDDWAFSEKLAQANLFCLPGSVVELPGYLRFSLTASDQMIDGALSVLAKQEIGHG
jgi:aspartate aminotransferase